ncbi:MAG: B12-binding domain-containing radical SAM protein [Desulfovibrionaceae bacterium]|nr:B12-binding domain-containing radical SAM protein [Desulfovibrionaceae bacterium]
MPSAKKPHIILIYPKTGMDFGSTVAPPHAVLTVAAPVDKEGYRVAILDQRIQRIDERALRELISDDLICVGVSSMTGTQIKNALHIAETVRRITDGRTPIVWGGTHPTVLPEQTLEHPLVDMVVVGEGEQTFLKLVKALENKESLSGILGLAYKDGAELKRNPNRPLMDVDDILPVPWHLLDVERYIHRDMYVKNRKRVLDIGQTSRGCPFKCGFCSSASIRGRKWRAKSVDNSLAQVVDTVRRFNLDGFWIRDDEFYINRKRAHEIFLGMIREKLDVSFYTSGTRVDVFLQATDDQLETMKRAGAHTLKFGAESGSQRILDVMQKGITPDMTRKVNLRCKEIGFVPSYGIVIGYPTDTFEDIHTTIDFAYGLKKDNPRAQLETFAQYTALPGTPSWSLALEYGLKPPTSLEGWTEWLYDDYDLEGEKLPWFSRQERVWLGNISYMSILANGLVNALDSIRSDAWRALAKMASGPTSWYFKTRLVTKSYKHVPELNLVRYLRHRLMYDSEKTYY